MDVFVTGATGYVGSAVTGGLLAAGYAVAGLARSGGSADALERRGVRPYRGDMLDAGDLRQAIRDSGVRAVVHAATTGDDRAEEGDRSAVRGTLEALRDTDGIFLYTSGGWVMGDTPGSADDLPADETSPVEPAPSLSWRPAVEQEVLASGEEYGVRPVVVRPALVYGRGGGVVAELVESARERGRTRYVTGPEGDPLWTLVHTEDLGHLYARVLRSREVSREGVLVVAAGTEPLPVREIAAEASRAAGAGGAVEPWPLAEARESLGPYADSLVLSQRLSGRKARRLFGWTPSAPSVFEELRRGSYAAGGVS